MSRKLLSHTGYCISRVRNIFAYIYSLFTYFVGFLSLVLFWMFNLYSFMSCALSGLLEDRTMRYSSYVR